MKKTKHKDNQINIFSLSLGIALLPPIWAVFAPIIGIRTGAVALICAGLYVANGNRKEDAIKILFGFLLGDLWSLLSLWMMAKMHFNISLKLYLTLFIMGGLAVIIGENSKKYILTSAWLCGWAIGLTIMGNLSINQLGTLPLEIGVAMIVGIIYVGVGVDSFQKLLVKKILDKN